MKRVIPPLVVVLSLTIPALAAKTDIVNRIDERFAPKDVQETPDFRQHVIPLMGKLGCNGRACHGSFQGRGGFRLSLFGYDFKMDHDGLTKGDPDEDRRPRVDLAAPEKSLALLKPTDVEPHEGGQRMTPDSWQYRVLLNWIRGGAENVAEGDPEFSRLEISPPELAFAEAGQTVQLKAVVVWSDGTREDVTPLCRFKTNNEQIAAINDAGLVTSGKPGDTHVVVFYDNGVAPVPVIRPVSDRVGPNYPEVETPTKIDELVVAKLRKLGIVPSERCTDAEFLRRVCLDVTGSLPTPQETEAFLADPSPDKRSKKIDELLQRPAYAAWWTTRLCDITGNNSDALNNVVPRGGRSASQDWYDWIYQRVAENVPYDDLVEGIVVASSRNKGESFQEYSEKMSDLYRRKSQGSFSDRESLPHYWARRNFRRPEERVIGFAYTFLGIRMQCAQCHKHPFDQWTQVDFKNFEGFFTRVGVGTNPAARDEFAAMMQQLGLKNQRGGQLRRDLPRLLNEGKTVPFQEVYAVKPRGSQTSRNRGNRGLFKNLQKQIGAVQARIEKLKSAGDDAAAKELQPRLVALKKRLGQAKRSQSARTGRGSPAVAKLLGGRSVDLNQCDDARTPLMQWLRSEDNPYFARALVNRVWAAYFNVGIVEPPDDLSLANPPGNGPLLDYLSEGFIRNGFDMKWLHRQIANSRTYQLSWKPNDTNRKDERNFSRAVPRRLPAEVAYDAVRQATSSDEEVAAMERDMTGRAIAIPGAGRRANNRAQGAGYALTIFGRSIRESNCDCDRSAEASLLQTVYLQNDRDVFSMIERNRGGWLNQVADALGLGNKSGRQQQAQVPRKPKNFTELVAQQEARIKKLRQSGNRDAADRAARRLAAFRKQFEPPRADKRPTAEEVASARLDTASIVKDAYLRTLSRLPDEEELNRSRSYIEDADNPLNGAKDLLWALLNTKEFIVNH